MASVTAKAETPMGSPVFDRHSRIYTSSIDAAIQDNIYARGYLFRDAVKREIAAGSRVLDYGCGPGRMSLLITEAGFHVDGVDPSQGMIAEAKGQIFDSERLSFRHSTSNGDDLTSGGYEGIVCSSVIEFVPDADALLSNFARALKPGGALFLSYSNKRSLWRAYAKRWLSHKSQHFQVQHNVWTFGQAKQHLAAAGFGRFSKPVYYEASPFDKRWYLASLSATSLIGSLGFVTARLQGAD